MKKGLKVLSTSLLLSTLFVAGCSCSKDDGITNVSRVENSDKAIAALKGVDVSEYTVLDLYNSLISADSGNTMVADKLIEFVANDVLELNKENSVWKTRYDNIVKEKLKDLASSSEYEVAGSFSEKLMESALKYEGYSITCNPGVYGTVEDLKCNYTDYINKSIKVEAYSLLLKQKYIQEEVIAKRDNVLTLRKIRDVEYFTVSSSLDDTYTDLNVRDFMRSLRDKIANKEVVDFETIEQELKNKMKEIVTEEYEKIGTSDDYSQSIAAKYTNNFTQDKYVGYTNKLKDIEKMEFNFEKLISSDTAKDAVVSEMITSSILSVSDTSDEEYVRRVVNVENSDGTIDCYLVNSNAGLTVDAGDILLSETTDASKYTYSIVRFKVIDSKTTDADDIYAAIELLAEKSTLANKAISHYLEAKKDVIDVYDDKVKEYLKVLYPDVFAE